MAASWLHARGAPAAEERGGKEERGGGAGAGGGWGRRRWLEGGREREEKARYHVLGINFLVFSPNPR